MAADLFGLCPFVTAQRLLQSKWSILIMHHVSGEPIRFNELQRRLPEMTHATLAKQLKQLEADGLIVRNVYPQVPPKVEYSLSEMGRKFDPVLEEFQKWGQEYIGYLKEKSEVG